MSGDGPARLLMGGTLGFHIILACLGIALPTIVVVTEALGLWRKDDTALLLARRWSQVLAVLVAVGAVTGTVLSFEMSLLWPGLMDRYGAVLGLPFGLEGVFFLLEAVFTAIYVYGWSHLPPKVHIWTGVPVVISGIFGAASVVAVNAWMNQPGGFTVVDGVVTHVDPWKVFFSGAFSYEVPHMVLAAYMVAGFLVATVYAWGWLRGRRDRYHRLGFLIPFVIAGALAPVQVLVGDVAARAIANDQPIKFAAMEYVTTTGSHQPEYLGGVYVDGKVYGALRIPDMDSILVGFSPDTVVQGLDSVPVELRPPSPTLLHLSFDAMVAIGTGLVLLPLWAAFIGWRRRRLPGARLFWWAAVAAGPAGVVAMECGWIVTEVGRQPWVVYGLLKTSEAATAADVTGVLTVVVIGYTALGAATIWVLRRMARRWR